MQGNGDMGWLMELMRRGGLNENGTNDAYREFDQNNQKWLRYQVDI
jgi:hypothetical protein